LAGFLLVGPGVEESSGAGVLPDVMEWLSSSKDSGDNMSSGFITVVEADSVPNRDGNISPGVERTDSVGELSNLTLGDGV
jgi:hypothetical protein